jgi:hypothetical protein
VVVAAVQQILEVKQPQMANQVVLVAVVLVKEHLLLLAVLEILLLPRHHKEITAVATVEILEALILQAAVVALEPLDKPHQEQHQVVTVEMEQQTQ